MREFADYTLQAKEHWRREIMRFLGELMEVNFDLRCKILGDEIIRLENLEMMGIARSNGCFAKFSGSGGVVIGMYGDERQFEGLNKIYRAHGFEFARVTI